MRTAVSAGQRQHVATGMCALRPVHRMYAMPEVCKRVIRLDSTHLGTERDVLIRIHGCSQDRSQCWDRQYSGVTGMLHK